MIEGAAAPNALAELREEAARDDSLRVEQPAAPGQKPEVAPPAPLTAEEKLAEQAQSWRFVIDLAADQLGALYPRLKAVYTEEARAGLAERIAAVAVKYNMTAFAFLDRYREELALLLFAAPIVRETVQAMKAPPAAAEKPAEPPPAAVKPAIAGDALKPNSGGG